VISQIDKGVMIGAGQSRIRLR